MSTSSESEPRITSEEIQKMPDRFRILVIGPANAGKTTILQRVCNSTGEPLIFGPNGEKIEPSTLDPSLKRGEHDIENQMIFASNPGFIFHDSRGFEAGGDRELKLVQQFIEQRSKTRNVNEQLHAIWYCIPTSDYRPITACERKFFNECESLVPVIVLWTKTEFLDFPIITQLIREGNSLSDAKRLAPPKAWADFKNEIYPHFAKFKHPPKAYMGFRKMNEPGANCDDLIKLTTAVLSGDDQELQRHHGLGRTLTSTESAPLENRTDKNGDRSLISAQNILIASSTFVRVENGGFHTHIHPSGMEKLRKIIAHGALHDSKERHYPPKCHQSTRRSVLKKIMEWVENIGTIYRFIWLYGSVGVGKSAIAQTIAELCFGMNILAASFFFSRIAADCSDSTLVIATIAYQLCLSIPEVKSYIEAVVERYPDILRLSLEAQVQKLIIWPLSQVNFQPTSSRSVSSRPNLIVIDGLDECGNEDMQRCILDALSGIFKSYSLPIYFLVTSRPEQHIHDFFHAEPLSSMTTFISLDDSYFPDNDIQVLLNSEFDEIKREHPLSSRIPASWPSEMEVKQLVQQSSGQFLYASMVVKYVKSPHHLPKERLDNIITGRGSDAAFAELDALYTRIFSSVDDIHTVLQVLSILLFSREHWFPHTVNLKLVQDLLDLQGDALHRKLIRLHSILNIPALDDDKTEIRILHPSLKDFLQNPTRSGQYYIDRDHAHAKLTQHLMTFIPSVGEKYCHNMDELPRLSCQFFMVHCVLSYPTSELLAALRQFDIHDFLSLLSNSALGMSPVTINRQISDLFDWLEHHFGRDSELYTSYLRAWDNHIITSLLVALEAPQVRVAELFVASTLHPQFWKHCTIIREIINWEEPEGEATRLPTHSLFQSFYAGELDEEEPNSGYHKMLSQFLNNHSRSGPLYAAELKFTCLATKTIQFITDGEVETFKFTFTDHILPYDDLRIWASQCLPFFLSKASHSKVLATLLETDLLPLVKRFNYSGQKKKSEVIDAINSYIRYSMLLEHVDSEELRYLETNRR